MRIAAIADLHCRTASVGKIAALLAGVEEEADVLLIAGDLTNLGLAEEMEVLLGELGQLSLPVLAVTGNHDHESDQAETLVQMLRGAGVHVVEGEAVELDGVGFAGAKGFCGGFGGHRLQPFGERMLKAFIHESIQEVVRLETALERLGTERKVALLHYSPVGETLRGEHPEIYPFLGFSLLADVLDRHDVNVAVHGHAHHGAPSGATPGGIPVYNVSRYVQDQYHGRPYRVFEV
jgi:Icc-related predicted phosphoesterase